MSSPSEHSSDYSSDDGFVKISQPDVVSVSSDSDHDVVSVSSESESDDGEMPDLVPVHAVTAQDAAATASKADVNRKDISPVDVNNATVPADGNAAQNAVSDSEDVADNRLIEPADIKEAVNEILDMHFTGLEERLMWLINMDVKRWFTPEELRKMSKNEAKSAIRERYREFVRRSPMLLLRLYNVHNDDHANILKISRIYKLIQDTLQETHDKVLPDLLWMVREDILRSVDEDHEMERAVTRSRLEGWVDEVWEWFEQSENYLYEACKNHVDLWPEDNTASADSTKASSRKGAGQTGHVIGGICNIGGKDIALPQDAYRVHHLENGGMRIDVDFDLNAALLEGKHDAVNNEARFDAMTAKFDAINARLDRATGLIEASKAQIDKIVEDVEVSKAKVDNVETTLNNLSYPDPCNSTSYVRWREEKFGMPSAAEARQRREDQECQRQEDLERAERRAREKQEREEWRRQNPEKAAEQDAAEAAAAAFIGQCLLVVAVVLVGLFVGTAVRGGQ